MPALRYFAHFEDTIKKWEALEPEQQEKTPAPELPPDELDLEVTFPDEWTMYHKFKFETGLQEVDGPFSVKLLFGTVALIDIITRNGEAVKLNDLDEWPLHYEAFFNWLLEVVYLDSYLPARTVKKKSI